jgi:threonine synthase
MDILISSNLERLIFQIAGRDADKTLAMMKSLSNEGVYNITDDMKAQMEDFIPGYASEQETSDTIKKLYDSTGYVIDTHTAVATSVYNNYAASTRDTRKSIIASTASPYKFTRSVMNAIDIKYDTMSDFELVDELSKIAGTNVPQAIEEIRIAPVLHNTVCESDMMQMTVEKILG